MVTAKKKAWGYVLEAKAKAKRLLRPSTGEAATYFLLFGRARTGSTLLQKMMDAHPDLGCEGELIRLPKARPMAHIDDCLSVMPERYRGFKLLSYQLREHFSDAERDRFRAWLTEKNVVIFHLKREDRVRHAISNLYASARGAYHSHSKGGDQHRTLHLDPSRVIEAMDTAQRNLAYEEAFLEGLDAMEVVYERDLSEPDDQDRTTAAVFERLGLPPHAHRPDLRRVTPQDLRQLIENYDEVVAAVKASEHGQYTTAFD